MYEVLTGTDVSGPVDVKIVLPDDGVIRIESAGLFAMRTARRAGIS
jgi:hypothetical protein